MIFQTFFMIHPNEPSATANIITGVNSKSKRIASPISPKLSISIFSIHSEKTELGPVVFKLLMEIVIVRKPRIIFLQIPETVKGAEKPLFLLQSAPHPLHGIQRHIQIRPFRCMKIGIPVYH